MHALKSMWKLIDIIMLTTVGNEVGACGICASATFGTFYYKAGYFYSTK